MTRILVIGSKGFIGSHAYEYFSKIKGYECWGCDVVVDYTDENYFLLDSSNSDFNDIFETKEFTICINCSGAASVPDSLVRPLRDFTLNVYNVFKILEAIRKHAPSCKFINLSSASVYGNPIHLPIEEDGGLQPVSPYGIHKLHSEQICKEFFDYWNIKTCSLRVFSAYGPGLKKQLFWDLYQKSLGSNKVELFGSGIETRDFIFIDDILQAIELVLNRSAFKAECINIANGQQISIKEAAYSFYKSLGWDGEITFKGEERKGDPFNWEADITKLQSLGYSQKYDLNAGLNKYVKWLKELE